MAELYLLQESPRSDAVLTTVPLSAHIQTTDFQSPDTFPVPLWWHTQLSVWWLAPTFLAKVYLYFSISFPVEQLKRDDPKKIVLVFKHSKCTTNAGQAVLILN